MFDEFIYKALDKIVEWCERYKKYRLTRSLPKECWDEKTNKASIKKWVRQQGSLINKNDTVNTGNTNTTNTKIQRR